MLTLVERLRYLFVFGRVLNETEKAFLKTTEPFGGLSNMAGGYPLLINNVRILTSEALYQACRFPHKSDV